MLTLWHIESGDLNARVRAVSPEDAFITAVKLKNPKSLGAIVQCTRKRNAGEPEGENVLYVSTEAVLRRHGLWEG